ncbi:Uncharacterised protein [Mesomycoplasma conjunctivae]|uniref:Uncharacterized protein n=1 Tax=Mesomycoplasma conjunctivae (strain ATCC 25834 / NCTC 10147 / HRC/581) TaxID=572263 RepID=C5J6T9_MESCH|nr:hypothetical protein [Mesomycoplasma conjunctivae]CAT05202.1 HYPOTHETICAL PROTEIN MCJ_004970 [Mesomycoplasma conjunctivae]VEU66208.1 Uncharacterised protein [Mesomycoplasma conjunctivae]VEU66413.1 Uncharacterised protein [Mesomycoplasma conjunctivae]
MNLHNIKLPKDFFKQLNKIIRLVNLYWDYSNHDQRDFDILSDYCSSNLIIKDLNKIKKELLKDSRNFNENRLAKYLNSDILTNYINGLERKLEIYQLGVMQWQKNIFKRLDFFLSIKDYINEYIKIDPTIYNRKLITVKENNKRKDQLITKDEIEKVFKKN